MWNLNRRKSNYVHIVVFLMCILAVAGSDGITGGALTEEEAKEKWTEFEIYYNAGLLEFEEVEDE